jgi:hypothetical protein
MPLFTTALERRSAAVCCDVLCSGELQGPVIRGVVPNTGVKELAARAPSWRT